MRQRCPGAKMIGTATLRRHRFIIMANGYASVVPASSSEVHGILWRVTPRDLVALDAYEDVAGGLYRRVMRPVIHNSTTVTRAGLCWLRAPRGCAAQGLYGTRAPLRPRSRVARRLVEGLERLAPGRFNSNSASGTGDRT